MGQIKGGLAFFVCTAAIANAQLSTTAEYFAIGEKSCAFSNTTWSVRISVEPGRRVRQRQEMAVTGLGEFGKYRVAEQCGESTNWVRISCARADEFGFATLRRATRLGAMEAASPAALLISEQRRIAAGDTKGIVQALVHLPPPARCTLAGRLQNTGVDPMAAGMVSLTAQRGAPPQFRLFATGQGGAFTLRINGDAIATFAAPGGELTLGEYPEGAPAIEAVRSISLADEGGREILFGRAF